MTAKRFPVRFFDECSHHKCQQQPRRRKPLGPHAANAPSGNPVKAVVVVAAVLGSETAEVLATLNFVIRGTKGSKPAKHERSLRGLAANSQTRRID